jgi:hypothetical protein
MRFTVDNNIEVKMKFRWALFIFLASTSGFAARIATEQKHDENSTNRHVKIAPTRQDSPTPKQFNEPKPRRMEHPAIYATRTALGLTAESKLLKSAWDSQLNYMHLRGDAKAMRRLELKNRVLAPSAVGETSEPDGKSDPSLPEHKHLDFASVSISGAIHSLSEVDPKNPMGSKLINVTLARAFSPHEYGAEAKGIVAHLSELGIESFLLFPHRKIPLVTSSEVVYRPYALCVTKGVRCIRILAGTIEGSAHQPAEPAEVKEGKDEAAAAEEGAPLIPSFTATGIKALSLDLGAGESLAIVYHSLGNKEELRGAAKSMFDVERVWAALNHPIHPGESLRVQEFTSQLLGDYKNVWFKKMMAERYCTTKFLPPKEPTLLDGIRHIGLENCEMTAIATAQLARERGLSETIYVASGATPLGKNAIDLNASDHAWNLVRLNIPASGRYVDSAHGGIYVEQPERWGFFSLDATPPSAFDPSNEKVLEHSLKAPVVIAASLTARKTRNSGSEHYPSGLMPYIRGLLKQSPASVIVAGIKATIRSDEKIFNYLYNKVLSNEDALVMLYSESKAFGSENDVLRPLASKLHGQVLELCTSAGAAKLDRIVAFLETQLSLAEVATLVRDRQHDLLQTTKNKLLLHAVRQHSLEWTATFLAWGANPNGPSGHQEDQTLLEFALDNADNEERASIFWSLLKQLPREEMKVQQDDQIQKNLMRAVRLAKHHIFETMTTNEVLLSGAEKSALQIRAREILAGPHYKWDEEPLRKILATLESSDH